MMAGSKTGKSTSSPRSTPSKTSAATRSKTDQNRTELENLDLKATLKSISEKLDTFLSENIKLREENAALSQRIDTLEGLLRDKENTPHLRLHPNRIPYPVAARTLKYSFSATPCSDT